MNTYLAARLKAIAASRAKPAVLTVKSREDRRAEARRKLKEERKTK